VCGISLSAGGASRPCPDVNWLAAAKQNLNSNSDDSLDRIYSRAPE
jgi:hypothetical protein